VSHESKKSYYFNRLGDSLYAVRAFCKAIEAYRQAILLAPQEAVCHANLAYALMSQGDYLNDAAEKRKHYSEAVDEFQRAITINRETAEYHYSLSRPLIKLHRLEPAAEELREAVRLDDKNVNARRDLAACLSRQGKFAEAVQALEASKEAYPSVLEIQMDLARAYAQAGEYSQAVSLAEQIGGVQNPPKQATELLAALRNAQETAGKLSTEPENAALFVALGHIHIQLGNLEAAVAQYRRAATLDPSNPEYYKWLGNTLFKEEEWEGAAAEWEKAIALAPDDALAINNLGTAYDNLEQNEKAMSCYQKASSLAPGKFVPQYNLGNSDYRLARRRRNGTTSSAWRATIWAIVTTASASPIKQLANGKRQSGWMPNSSTRISIWVLLSGERSMLQVRANPKPSSPGRKLCAWIAISRLPRTI
jgi:tetratricopeptide (TPR) repeat protein